jgi:oligopeptide/dipeptide ABC transporter ATP-binding protein
MLALALVGLLPPGARRSGHAWFSERGRDQDLVSLGERELTDIRGRDIGFVFQEPMTALNPVMRIGAQIAETLLAHQPDLSRSLLERHTIEALERACVPMPEVRAKQFPHELSGGLRQRAMIAMALAAEPRLLIADEATTALDVTVQKEVLELLSRLRRELRLSLLFITHDLGVVAQIADRVAVMYAGEVVEVGPVSTLLAAPKHPYTSALLRASPRLEARSVLPIPGSVPALDAIPFGCAFAPRCEYRQEECCTAAPPWRQAGAEHFGRCILIAPESRQ